MINKIGVRETLPDVTIIIPVYNAAQDLRCCLESLRAQDYPQDKVRILVIDDDSSDSTRDVAESYAAVVLRNGHRNIERGKSIGLAHATTEFIFLIDSDNRLSDDNWLRVAVRTLVDNPDVVGVQAAWFAYNHSDPPANRYCSLFGIGDPLAYYLRKFDHLPYLDKEWTLGGTVMTQTDDCFFVRFTPLTMPTIGSQGFLTRKSLLEKTHWTPSLFHVDVNMELVASGHDLYAILRRAVVHDGARSIAHLRSKLERNGALFLEQRDDRPHHVWTTTNRWAMLKSMLIMATVVLPLRDALHGYRRVRDPAWFIHPLISLYMPFVYTRLTFQWMWHRMTQRRVPGAVESTT